VKIIGLLAGCILLAVVMMSSNSSNAEWMKSNWHKLHYRRLIDISFPGSHNAGNNKQLGTKPICQSDYRYDAFREYTKSMLSRTEFDNLFLHWNVNHDLSVSEQLESGIRFFHLKLCWIQQANAKISLGSIYHQHRGYTSVTLESILADVVSFLNRYPNEVVFLGFMNLHQIPDPADLLALILDQVQDKIGLIAGNDMVSTTLQTLFEENKRLGLFFPGGGDDLKTISPEDYLYEHWDSTSMESGNLTAVENWLLKDIKEFATKRDKFYVLQANPNQGDGYMYERVASGSLESLKTFELPFIKRLKDFIAEALHNVPHAKINSISTDFAPLADTVDIAISLND